MKVPLEAVGGMEVNLNKPRSGDGGGGGWAFSPAHDGIVCMHTNNPILIIFISPY